MAIKKAIAKRQRLLNRDRYGNAQRDQSRQLRTIGLDPRNSRSIGAVAVSRTVFDLDHGEGKQENEMGNRKRKSGVVGD